MKTRIITLAIVTLFCTGSLLAQIDRTKQPPAGPAPQAAFPDYQEERLGNGLKVLLISNHSQPVVTFRLMIKSGSENDGAGKSGVASFTTDLMTKGTKTRSSLQFAREGDMIGVNVGASAADDQMSFFGSGLKKHTEKILDLMTDALFNPTFPQDEIDKLKKQTLSGLKSEKKDPGAISDRLKITVAYAGHPYANFGTEESTNAITRDDIVNFHKTYFIPANASLAIVGDVTPEEIMPLVKKYFGAWQGGSLPSVNLPAIKPIKGKGVHLVDLGTTQSQTEMCIVTTGLKRKDADNPTLRLANSILGGGFSGRLFQNLREKRAFTYGAYSSLDSRKMGGLWEASASVRRIATDSAIVETLGEMKRMQTEPVPAEELDRHKQYFAGTFLLSLESPMSVVSRMQDIDLYGLPKDYYKTYISKVMAVSAEDIQKAAKKYWNTDNVAITAVGDGSVIKPLLETFGDVKEYDTDMKPIESAIASDIDGETLLKKHLAAIGTEAAVNAIKDRVMEGTVKIAAGPQTIEGTIKEVKARPNRSYENMTVKMMGSQEKWCDGKGVVTAAGPRVNTMEGEELAEELEDAEFLPLFRAKELGWKVNATVIRKINGTKVYVLEVERKHGRQTLLIDANTWLLFGEDRVQTTPEGTMTLETRYSDYRDVDGVKVPFKVSLNVGQAVIDIDVTSIKHNTNPPAETFTKK